MLNHFLKSTISVIGLILCAAVGVLALIVIALVPGIPTTSEAFSQLAVPWKLVVIALLTVSVPMNMKKRCPESS